MAFGSRKLQSLTLPLVLSLTVLLPAASSAAGHIQTAPDCFSTEQLAGLWPPSHPKTYVEGTQGVLVDVSTVPIEDVEVVAVARGDMRGHGQQAYLAYRIPGPPWGKVPLTVLATLDEMDGRLVNIVAIDEYWDGRASLSFLDLAGDGRDELVFQAGVGTHYVRYEIWRWDENDQSLLGRYSLELAGGSFSYLDIRDLDGDGRPEVITFEAIPYLAAGGWAMWPTAYVWQENGHKGPHFSAALFPALYDNYIAAAERLLQLPVSLPAEAEVLARTQLGHALTIQGRTAEAQRWYALAWARYQGTEPPSSCARMPDNPSWPDALDVVERYYKTLGEAVQGAAPLPRAYAMLGADLRRTQSFPDFAAQFARTRSVRLITWWPVDGNVFAYQVLWGNLSPAGEVQRPGQGSLRVSQSDQICTLEAG